MKEPIFPMQSTPADAVTHSVTLEGSANALAVSRDSSQVVVAGRNGTYGRKCSSFAYFCIN